ncbi:MAG: hypothetical protein V3U72_02270 [Candidatus Aenigmarchaeota archaeon]
MVYDVIKPLSDYISANPKTATDIFQGFLIVTYIGGLTLGGKWVVSRAYKKLQRQRAHEEYVEITGSEPPTSTNTSEVIGTRKKFQM